MNRRVKEAFYVVRFPPELNKQVQSFDRLHADFYSDDEQTDQKILVQIFLTTFYLNF